MKVICYPSVHLSSAPVFYDHPKYVLPTGGTPSERLIAHAGKGCYDSYGPDGRSIDLHVGALLSTRHGSVLEHANVSLFIEGISRGCSHEIVRHRSGFAYSQRSTRYTAEGEASIVLDPYYTNLYNKVDRDMDEAAIVNSFIMSCERDFIAYKNQVEWLMEVAPKEKTGVERRKWARGKARQLLPHALETRLTMTGNLRAWRFFIEQRSERYSEMEIRRLASVIMPHLASVAPLVFKDMVDAAVTIDGYPEYISPLRKV